MREKLLGIPFAAFIFAQLFVRDPTQVTVKCPAGTIVGQTGRLNSSVHEFLGIPFAEPPTGSLRFEPPVRKSPCHNTIPARKFGLSCPSFFDFDPSLMPFNSTAPEGEDCLSLNVWARPSLKNAPVLVWFYGGAYEFGTSNLALYDGTYFAAHNDVVMVTVNYRLNVFGFPNSPAVKSENLAMLDQRAAVEWVQENIAAFGGDARKITIFGHSAGGSSVDIWSYAWPDDPIVHGFIEMSGTSSIVGLLDGGSTYDAWNNLTVAIGCGHGTAKEQLECAKSVDFTTIKSALNGVFHRPGQCTNTYGYSLGRNFFGPRVDGKIIFSLDEYKRKGESGKFAKLPLLVGSLDTENEAFQMPPTKDPNCDDVWQHVPSLPPSITPELWAQLATDIIFTCPARRQARFRAAHHVPVWRYRYFGTFNFTIPRLNALGALHSLELPVLFGYAAEIANLPPREMNVMAEMQKAWTSFARDPVNGLSSFPFNWNKYTPGPSDESLVRIAYKGEMKASMGDNTEYDYWCDIMENVGTRK